MLLLGRTDHDRHPVPWSSGSAGWPWRLAAKTKQVIAAAPNMTLVHDQWQTGPVGWNGLDHVSPMRSMVHASDSSQHSVLCTVGVHSKHKYECGSRWVKLVIENSIQVRNRHQKTLTTIMTRNHHRETFYKSRVNDTSSKLHREFT